VHVQWPPPKSKVSTVNSLTEVEEREEKIEKKRAVNLHSVSIQKLKIFIRETNRPCINDEELTII
jgi:hypothetical protein